MAELDRRGVLATLAAYDVTRRETFENLSEIWLREVDMYSTVQDAVWMIVGNKIDRNAERAVSRAEGVSASSLLTTRTKSHSRSIYMYRGCTAGRRV